MRLAIQSALVFDAETPEYLLLEYDNAGMPRCIGQFFTLEDAIKGAHERVNSKPPVMVIERRP